MHFYTHFTYDNTFSFDDYFNQNLINLCTKFGIFVKDLKQFKIYCYSFYYQLVKEIKNFNYVYYKQLYRYYSISALEEEKILQANGRLGTDTVKAKINDTDEDVNMTESSCSDKSNVDSDKAKANTINSIIELLKNYVKNIKNMDLDRLKFGLTCKAQSMIPLISTTERIVDMVLSVSNVC